MDRCALLSVVIAIMTREEEARSADCRENCIGSIAARETVDLRDICTLQCRQYILRDMHVIHVVVVT